ncbi:MAG TPA: nickel ABC transporter permease [Candidatus Deferrimicrobiaceae bacterium]
MKRFLLARLRHALLVALGVATLVFLLIHLIPGDPVDVMLGESAVPADKAELRHALKLDRPLAAQYGEFLLGLSRGDLGTSFRSREPVAREILSRFPATLLLACASLAVALLIAVPLGIAAAMRPGSWVDLLCGTTAMLGLSTPNFVIGPMLVLLFSIQLGVLPVSGHGGWRHLVLPALTLGSGMSAILMRMLRSSLLEEIGQDYVRTARAKGMRPVAAVVRHALPNASIPVVTVIGLQFGALLAGSVITETLFSWPGIGRLTVQAIDARDYPLVQGCVLFIALLTVAVNLAADLAYARLDPRIRHE